MPTVWSSDIEEDDLKRMAEEDAIRAKRAPLTVTDDLLRARLEQLEHTHIEIINESDEEGIKFNVSVVSKTFEEKKLIQRHMMVNGVIIDLLEYLHGVTVNTFTPAEWEIEQAERAEKAEKEAERKKKEKLEGEMPIPPEIMEAIEAKIALKGQKETLFDDEDMADFLEPRGRMEDRDEDAPCSSKSLF